MTLNPTIVQETTLVTRYPGNPILTAKDLDYPSDLVFNAGVVKHNGKYIMLFRNDYHYPKSMFDNYFAGKGELWGPSTNIGLATSDDGFHWTPAPQPVIEINNKEIRRVYDPRISVIDNTFYVALAIDTMHNDNRCGLYKTIDFKTFEEVTITAPNNRNMLLFPEKINGLFYRLERPFSGDVGDIWISSSPDLQYWGNWKRLVASSSIKFCNRKIGPGAIPVKTKKGWLALFHTVTHTENDLYSWGRSWRSQYSMGLMLLDLEDPTKVIGIYDQPLLEPQEKYELEGFRGSVLFPGAMIPEDDGSVKIYYGAADTVECVATAQLDDLLRLF